MTISWYRQRHDWYRKPCLRAIAERLKQPLAFVTALCDAAWNHASKARDRGSVADFDAHDEGLYLGIPEDAAGAIWAAFEAKGILTRAGGILRIADWESLQPQDPEAFERKRRQREREREPAPQAPEEAAVTPCHGVSRQDSDTDSTPLNPPIRLVASQAIDQESEGKSGAAAPERKPRGPQPPRPESSGPVGGKDQVELGQRWLHARMADAARRLPAARYAALMAALLQVSGIERMTRREVLATLAPAVRGELDMLDRAARDGDERRNEFGRRTRQRAA